MTRARFFRCLLLHAPIGLITILGGRSSALAQGWTSNGLLLAGSPTSPSAVVSDSAGGEYVIWSTYQGAPAHLFVTRRLNDGTRAPGWPAEGLMVCPSSRQDFFAAAADDSGGVILCWQDRRGSPVERHGFYAQRVRPDASVAWPDTGLQISARAVGDRPFILPDGSRGALVVWLNNAALDTLRAGHLTSAGTLDPSWPAGGLILCASGNSRGPNSLISDGAGGGIFLWHDMRFGNADIFAQRFTPAGQLASGWPANGAAVAVGVGDQFYPVAVPDGRHGAIVTFEDWRDVSIPAISVQHVTGAGTIGTGLPAEGVVVSTAAGTRGTPTAVSDDAGGAYLAWGDTRNGPTNVYALRVDSTGTTLPGWTANGTRVCPLLHVQGGPALIPDGSSGVFVTWSDRRDDLDDDVYVQDLLASGVARAAWPADGRAMCVFPGNQNRPMIVGDGAGGAFVTWHDDRSGGDDLYGGHIGQDGVVPALLSLVDVKVNEGAVALEWFGAEIAPIRATIDRRTERSAWTALGDVSSDGTGYVRYLDASVSPGGRYAYRLGYLDAGKEQFTSEVWVEVPALRLALAGLQPNPSSGAPRIAFSLANAEPATLDVVDVTGRRVARREVGSLGPGAHVVTLGESLSLKPGTYLLRLAQGTRVVVRRGVLVR